MSAGGDDLVMYSGGGGPSVAIADSVVRCAGAGSCKPVTLDGDTLVLRNVSVEDLQEASGDMAFVLAAGGTGSVHMYGGQCRTPAGTGRIAGSGGSFRGAGVHLAVGPPRNPHYVNDASLKCVGCFGTDFDPLP